MASIKLRSMPKYKKAMDLASDVETSRTKLASTAFNMAMGSKHLALRERLKVQVTAAALATHVRIKPCAR
jgi:hypothetical protein